MTLDLAQVVDADESVSRKVQRIRHRIAQPVNALRLLSDALRRRVNGAAGALEILDLVDGAVTQLDDMILSMLSMIEADAGLLLPVRTTFEIWRLFERLRFEFDAKAQENGVALRFVGTSATVASDPWLIGVVLRNLIANALSYTPRGGRVVVGCRRQGDSIRIMVCDNGVGMKHCWQKGQARSGAATGGHGSPAPGGLGMGLEVVGKIAQVLGHGVTLRSAPGQGSAFGISLPRANAQAAGR